jgi:GH43 family beta-xylosidase
MYSGNGADTADYGVGIAEGSTPLGPFTKREDNPILHAAPQAQFYGPGHHSVVEGAEGDLLMFYHTKVAPELGYDRRIRYVPVSFSADGPLTLDVPQPR